ncbi:2,3-bisphosphoglycerate-dependent phosphoglycerate mutase [Mycolicibacterium frederiksbergense]|uniref:2,3-bisphosphoglycerate-dependent phosphoglycerate mutase n=1 Tax=Mycolicibacterium frederiksbergense TaxID=117567 RepID=A0A6H0S0Y5_9MYCO|nr:2,3-bisphosphoglycerate-dependent phosphoglycerate mutase [Mycolicibacterium frederiksbergense]QIV79975.1 2,3-bisphosphoglycerate-dependent phosphoglycerate mutase [Mycolicibacterium frederiksbergense]
MSRVLLLMRHGESAANAAGAFGGWLDVPLTTRGRAQAAEAGRAIRAAGLIPAALHTSMLDRAVETAAITVREAGVPDLSAARTWRLNERHYGALQGRARRDVESEFGPEQVALWRRSYELAPPPTPMDDPGHPRLDARYATIADDELPVAESLADVRARLLPYWESAIAPDCARHAVTLVVAHGNSLRMLRMFLDDLTREQVRSLDIPTGVPVRYDLDDRLRPLVIGGIQLCPDDTSVPTTRTTEPPP